METVNRQYDVKFLQFWAVYAFRRLRSSEEAVISVSVQW